MVICLHSIFQQIKMLFCTKISDGKFQTGAAQFQGSGIHPCQNFINWLKFFPILNGYILGKKKEEEEEINKDKNQSNCHVL